MRVAELLSNIDAAQAQRAARAERLREQKAKSFYSSFQWRKVRYLFLRQQSRPLRCSACGRSAADGVTLCVDHVKSVKKYPELKTTLSNLQVLCGPCNTGKGSEWADDWRATSEMEQQHARA
jgi:5-methylcytosine-specific restriction endonuclease McrA